MESALTFLHGALTPQCTARVDKMFDGYYTLQFMASGGIELYYGAQQHHQLSGRWFWTSFPGPRIRFHPGAGFAAWTHRYVAFRGPLVARWMMHGLWPQGPQAVPPGHDYEALFDAMLDQSKRTDRWGVLHAANMLEGILLDLAEARAVAAPREPWLGQVMGELERADAYMPDYTALAATCGMGLSTLRRRFREATGTPLHAFVLQKRMDRARRLLGESDVPIKAIAERLGYNDVFFFSRQFGQLVGVTPAAYRKSRQN